MLSKLWILLLSLFLTHCVTNKLSQKDIKDMKSRFILEYGKAPDLWPIMVGLEEEVDNIFSVPSENAVGTNEVDNAISSLKFEGDKIHYEELIKDYPGAGAGGFYSYCPVFDREWIAYGQSRGFSLFNLKTKQFVDHIPYPRLEKRITDVCAIPNQPFTFLIQIERGNTPADDRVLQVVQFDLKGNFTVLAELEQIGRHSGERGEPLIIRDNKLFGEHTGTFEVFDLKTLKPTQHPLTTFLNNLDKLDIKFNQLNEMVIHPKYPFAILKELLPDNSLRVWLARWEHSEVKERFIPIIEQKLIMFSDIKELNVACFEFSPDGKWLVFQDFSEDFKNPYFICMPVDKNEDYFIGKPKMLGKIMRKGAIPKSSAWISEPLSYVVSDGIILYKWELENIKREF